MFWVALATAIMMLSGEGDDTRAIGALLAGLRDALTQTLPASARRTEALHAVSEFERAFATHREQLQEFGKCVDAADRRYHATRADYAACADRVHAQRIALRGTLETIQRDYETVVSPGERAQVAESVARLPEAWVLDPALALDDNGRTGTDPPRSRGLEGVAAGRHLTLPRNVVSIVYGPLGPATFGQRYPSKIIDAGTSYARQNITGSNVAPGVAEQWFTRLGVRFGLFDDLEAGALFLPFEVAPDFRFDSVLVFLTQQFRLKGFDLGLRLSFQTPGDTGWALAPGAVVGTRGRRLALQAGLFFPMEVGSFGEPQAPAVGFNAPVRVTWNVVPSFFLSADSGVAYDDLGQADRTTVPLGLGAGYTWLAGSRSIEFTTSFSWDHWLLPGRPNDASAFQFKTFRVALGATCSFQAL